MSSDEPAAPRVEEKVMYPVELVGEKVRVVLPEPGMAAAAVKYFADERPHHAATNSALPPDFYSEAFWFKRLNDALAEFATDRAVRLFMQDPSRPDEFIGVINFTQIFRGPFQACYLGYSIAKAHEGQGKMYDGLRLAIRYIFESRHLHRIMANHLPENARSARVLARLGFRVDGTSPDYLFINGAWREHVMTSLTNSAWTPRSEDAELFLG